MGKYFRPLSTLAVGIVIGYVVVPKIRTKIGG
jgi:hypothetical protein